jgi:hypothetical protein
MNEYITEIKYDIKKISEIQFLVIRTNIENGKIMVELIIYFLIIIIN